MAMAIKTHLEGSQMQWLARFIVVALVLSPAASLYGQQSDYAALRPPRPETPSVPGLEVNESKLVPGLELINPAYAPTLTADMKTLVFSGGGSPNDLYITQRESVEKPFGPPARITGCSNRLDETFPSISPDGLELLFARFGPQPKLYYSRRETTAAEFETAVPWQIAEALPEGRYPGGPQFIDQLNVQFVTRGATADKNRAIMLTARNAPGTPFGEPSVFMNLKGPNPYWLSADRLRAYYGVPNGLYFAAMKPESDAFSNPSKIADVPIDGPVWLSPKEDILFYCSPNRGKAVDEMNRRLWMLRL
ncbi:hypothetical protein AYO47_00675 [Planctomyces sp. SCGC AG-212-M04]|nr:hypothetical protein AYO47_00675 [Planctomyces sp. SCGC AG-212-M04]